LHTPPSSRPKGELPGAGPFDLARIIERQAKKLRGKFAFAHGVGGDAARADRLGGFAKAWTKTGAWDAEG